MALNATIYKAELQIADMDRHYYATQGLTLAQHPSETDIRLMVRLVVFGRHASDSLAFTKGISTIDEPDLWQKDLTGTIEVWIDIGQPDEKRIRKACGRAKQVFIYCYSGSSAELWWQKVRGDLERFANLEVVNIPANSAQELTQLTQRTMHLQCTIQDEQFWLGNSEQRVEIGFEVWKAAGKFK